MMVGSGYPGSSAHLSTSKYADALGGVLGRSESVVDTIDGRLEVLDPSKNKPYFDIAFVLTDERLIAVRGKGVMGVKRPLQVRFDQVTQVAVSQQANVTVEYRGAMDRPERWKMIIGGDSSTSDRWMDQIYRYCTDDPDDVTATGEAPPESEASSAFRRRDFKECRTRLQVLIDAAESRGLAGAVGQIFGQGHGLEALMDVVAGAFLDGDDVRQAGSMMALDILMASDDGVGPDQLDQVMGLDGAGSTRDVAGFKAAVDLGGAAKVFLGQFNEPGESIWELWKGDDEVAVEFLCWHTVARLRLSAARFMKPLTPLDEL